MEMAKLLMARRITANRDGRVRRVTIARFDASGAAMAACISVVPFIWCSGCVPALRGPAEQNRPKTLQVAHVVSERRFLAGFPVDTHRVVTDKRSLQPLPVAVVDGFPMGDAGARAAAPGSAARRDESWLVLYGRGLRARPNQIEPQQDLHAGDAVLLGGFFAPRDGLTPIDYAEVQSSVIIGRLVGIPNAASSGSPIHWVLVPPGDYHAFLGGPAASNATCEGIRVWGAIARVVPLQHGLWPLGTLLAVSKLSPRLSSSGVGDAGNGKNRESSRQTESIGR